MMQSQTSLLRARRGSALIIVLGCLVILLAVLLGFLNTARVEMSSSKTFADSDSLHSLVDTSVNVVMSQIRQATVSTATLNDSWTSQPGLIRTFTNAGVPDMSYKLYSSSTMTISGALIPSTEEQSLNSWSTEPALFTDLNAPVAGVYPILDAQAVTESTSTTTAIQGFIVASGTATPSTSAQALPMPVNWLYVLQDGTLVAPTAGATGSIANVAGATSSNPIVGRVAFWTDDETCKVNINTASEGEYWDVPHFTTVTDQNLGIYQPVANEFQGYPGHPAGVNLSAVFPTLVGTSTAMQNDAFYAITPRVEHGGSMNGTVPVNSITGTLTLDADRLYDSPDELMFSSTSTSTGTTTSRLPNPYATYYSGTSTLTQANLQAAKFFITAHSRSPETTLFGTPRIACWPISSTNDTNHRTAFDSLIAFCSSTTGTATYPYYFQRQNSQSQTQDSSIARNQILFAYLQTLLGKNVPGFGGNLATKFGADTNQILTEIFDYIRCTNLNDQNFSSSTYQYAPGQTNKTYGQGEVAPILFTPSTGSTTYRGFGHYVTFNEAALWLICTADPLVASPASNVASNETLAETGTTVTLLTTTATTTQIRIEAALILDPFTPMHGAVSMRPDINVFVSGLDGWSISGNADNGTFTPLGFPSLTAQTGTGAGILQLGDFPNNIGGMFNYGGYMGLEWLFDQRGVYARNGGRLPQDTLFSSSLHSTFMNEQYPFVSQPVTVNVSRTNRILTFSGGTISLTVQQSLSGTGNTPTAANNIQTLTFIFPETTLPGPTISTSTASPESWTFQSGGCIAPPGTYPGRFVASGGLPYFDTADDVIYSMVAAQGSQTLDPRFIAMTGTDTQGVLFQTHPYYKAPSSTAQFANTLIDNPEYGQGSCCPSGSAPNGGTLAAPSGFTNSTYPYHNYPCPAVPYPAAWANSTGDWDNGIGEMPDGGYLNEPDQGSVKSDNNNTSTILTPYISDGIQSSATFTSPNRMMPSPGMFGSLPTTFLRSQANNFTGGSGANSGWQTLLFRRQPTHPSYVNTTATGTTALTGLFSNAPDYLIMDLFWMPVVQPYAISQMLSTDGKINMNYQIIPFTYITRSTGMYAVLDQEKVVAVPSADYNKVYKNVITTEANYSSHNYRVPIDIKSTLAQFDLRFNSNENGNGSGTGLYAFRAPCEICDVNLIPNGLNPSSTQLSSWANIDSMMATYWSTHTLTGDNMRERPYTTIYPRLTTRSNTFRVHYRVQTLKKLPNSTATVWTEGSDLVTSEARGSVVIERYLDANDTSIPDYGSNPAATPSLESKYQFRTLSMNRFAP